MDEFIIALEERYRILSVRVANNPESRLNVGRLDELEQILAALKAYNKGDYWTWIIDRKTC